MESVSVPSVRSHFCYSSAQAIAGGNEMIGTIFCIVGISELLGGNIFWGTHGAATGWLSTAKSRSKKVHSEMSEQDEFSGEI